jgi:serine/threonine protein kinase
LIGSQLAHFRITAKLGAGGMGEVYRAEDSKLGREVAIKVLPAAFVANEDLLTRFEREARVLARLTHPQVAGIYEVGEEDGVHFLVMELVPGRTLADRLADGPLRRRDAVAIAAKIARGLEAAHEQGIVHRDLKPGNVMVDDRGGVKILDFGLAKALGPAHAPGAATIAATPTLPLGATLVGTVLGTAAYMSPEQARGEAADQRSDIWSFGVVLWEMLTGRRLFGASSLSDTLAAVLRDEIDSAAVPSDCPAAVKRTMLRCLERDPEVRLHHIADARIELEAVLGDESAWRSQVDSGRPPRRLLIAAAAMIGLLLGGLSTWMLATHQPPPSVSESALQVELSVAPATLWLNERQPTFALSPDGDLLVLALEWKDGPEPLYLRRLDRRGQVPIAGSVGGSWPFFAPDGQRFGFFADGKLKTASVDGGVVEVLCDAPNPWGGTWGQDGSIVFTPVPKGGLWRLDELGCGAFDRTDDSGGGWGRNPADLGP